jgi:sugar lactone lactonase YvrE
MFRPSLLLAAAASVAVVVPARAQTLESHALPATIAYPEGIAFDAAEGAFYTASALDGAVTKFNLATDAATAVTPAGVLVPAGTTTFPAVLGMKIDEAKRLWLAGGRTGKMHVLDTKTGKLLKTLDTPAAPAGLINDVTLTADAAYFSDSFRPIVWKVSRAGGKIGEAEAWLDIGPVVIHGEGANINGLAATPDGKTLILAQMNKGLLFKVDIATKRVTPIDLKGQTLAGADGLVLDGQRLYAVLQPHSEVVAIDLAPDMTSGAVVGRLKTSALAWPATAAKTGDKLLVVNTQFNTRATNAAKRPFTVSEVPVAAIK